MYCLCRSVYFCVVLCIVCFVSFPVLFVCICVQYYRHRVATQLQLNIYHILSDLQFAPPVPKVFITGSTCRLWAHRLDMKCRMYWRTATHIHTRSAPKPWGRGGGAGKKGGTNSNTSSVIWYIYLQLGSHPVAVVQYTYTHKQYRERHKTNNT